MIKLSEIIEEGSIDVSLNPAPKDEIITAMVDLLARSAKVVDREEVLKSVLKREAEGSTGIGEGVAIPHSKSAGVTSLAGALGICPAGTDFDSLDGGPVYLVFLLEAVPENPGPHVQALGSIARLIRQPDFISTLLACRTPAEVHQALVRFEETDL